jgi:hypothetical protein
MKRTGDYYFLIIARRSLGVVDTPSRLRFKPPRLFCVKSSVCWDCETWEALYNSSHSSHAC